MYAQPFGGVEELWFALKMVFSSRFKSVQLIAIPESVTPTFSIQKNYIWLLLKLGVLKHFACLFLLRFSCSPPSVNSHFQIILGHTVWCKKMVWFNFCGRYHLTLLKSEVLFFWIFKQFTLFLEPMFLFYPSFTDVNDSQLLWQRHSLLPLLRMLNTFEKSVRIAILWLCNWLSNPRGWG